MLSQCDNLLLMRMNFETDLGYLRDTFSFFVPWSYPPSSTFQLGETLVAGKSLHPTYVKFGSRIFKKDGGQHRHRVGHPLLTPAPSYP